MTDYTNVSTRALIATLTVSVWGARRFDSAVSDEVNAEKKADRSSGRFNKHLFGTRRAGRGHAPEFFAVIDARDALRDMHDKETLPWGKRDGERLLPTTNYFSYTEKLRKAGLAFDAAVDAFVDAYPRLVREAEPRLGALYSADDFVKVDRVRERFSYSVGYSPIAMTGDVRVALPAEAIAEIEASVTKRVEDAAREAMTDAWERLREAVARIHKASGENGVVRSTLIDHAREVTDVLARLNVAEDADLERMRKRVADELTSIAVEDLRTDDKLRKDTERRAADIMKAMSGLYVPLTEVA